MIATVSATGIRRKASSMVIEASARHSARRATSPPRRVRHKALPWRGAMTSATSAKFTV